jgi:hypothetical protein
LRSKEDQDIKILFFSAVPTPIIQPLSQTKPSAQAQPEVEEETQVVEEP